MLAPSVSSLLAAAEVTTVLALTTGRVTSNQIEEQRHLRSNERRTIGYRDNDGRERFENRVWALEPASHRQCGQH
jgi:hypothetical protein